MMSPVPAFFFEFLVKWFIKLMERFKFTHMLYLHSLGCLRQSDGILKVRLFGKQDLRGEKQLKYDLTIETFVCIIYDKCLNFSGGE